MSILIKGVEMPKEGCSHTIYLYADGEVVTGGRVYKAVPVPPHGRLIDADAVCKRIDDNIRKYCTEADGGYCLAEDAMEEVKLAETVLEGDKE